MNSTTLEEQLDKIEKFVLSHPRSNIKEIAKSTGINRQLLSSRILLLKDRGKIVEHEVGRAKVFELAKGERGKKSWL